MLVYINALGLMHCASDMCGCVVSRNMFMGFATFPSSNPPTSFIFPYFHIIEDPLSPASWQAGWPCSWAWQQLMVELFMLI